MEHLRREFFSRSDLNQRLTPYKSSKHRHHEAEKQPNEQNIFELHCLRGSAAEAHNLGDYGNPD